MKKVLLLAVVLLCTSCAEKKETEYEKLIRELTPALGELWDAYERQDMEALPHARARLKEVIAESERRFPDASAK